VRLGNALKGHFSRGTTVPVFTVFMDPSPKARVFMKTINLQSSGSSETTFNKGLVLKDETVKVTIIKNFVY
jgi:hypothetical protein